MAAKTESLSANMVTTMTPIWGLVLTMRRVASTSATRAKRRGSRRCTPSPSSQRSESRAWRGRGALQARQLVGGERCAREARGQALELLQRELEENQVELVREYNLDLPQVYCDERQIKHVFLNLFLNFFLYIIDLHNHLFKII